MVTISTEWRKVIWQFDRTEGEVKEDTSCRGQRQDVTVTLKGNIRLSIRAIVYFIFFFLGPFELKTKSNKRLSGL